MGKVTFTDKEDVRTTATAAENKVAADDMNELKNSINALYNKTGWANYADSVATNIVLNTTDQLVTIDGLGSNTNEDYLPLDVRGGSDVLWNSNKIAPTRLGDTYDIRFSFTVAAKSGNPNIIDFKLDIGGLATPAIVIAERILTAEKTAPYSTSFSLPVFCLATFLANGGQFFAKTDTGTVTLSNRSILIVRTHSEL